MMDEQKEIKSVKVEKTICTSKSNRIDRDDLQEMEFRNDLEEMEYRNKLQEMELQNDLQIMEILWENFQLEENERDRALQDVLNQDSEEEDEWL